MLKMKEIKLPNKKMKILEEKREQNISRLLMEITLKNKELS
jgi:hypothetical protein